MAKPDDKKPTPAYASHTTYLSLMETLRGDGHELPDQIDRGSVLRTMSGSAASAMIKTLEALGLVDGHRRPTTALRELLAYPQGSPQYKIQAKAVLQQAYPYLFSGDINLKTATTTQVQSAFREQGVTGSTVSKAIAFFLAAAKDADIEISKYVRTPPMAETTTKKRNATSRSVVVDDDENEGEVLELVQDDLHPALAGLLRTLPAPGQPMSAKDRQRFMTAFEAVLAFAHPAEEGKKA
jgi:hypothetical protein